MEIRQLRYLLAIAETSSFTKAAEQVFVTQSALSQQIQVLEQEVGTLLLDRSKRGVRLTAAGEILCHHAIRVMRELDQANTAMRELEDLRRGELMIGAVQTVNAYFVPSLITAFNSRYPDVRLVVEELAADDIEQALESGQLQVGIGFTPPTKSEIGFESLFDEELVLIVQEDHPLASVGSIPVIELDEMPMIMLAKTFCTRRLWEENARLASAQPRVVMEMNTVSGILSVVSKTGIPTILPAMALDAQSSNHLTSVRLENPTPSRQVGAIWHRDSFLCAASRAFLALTKEIGGHFRSKYEMMQT